LRKEETSLNIIEVSNLSKNFGDFKAVKNISFDVQKGEIFGFLGPNGAGKTTTINMLTGLAKPSSGEIKISGQDGIRHIKKVQRIIGIAPDESNLYEELSGYENLIFCASLYGIKKEVREKRAHELLKQFSLNNTGDRPFKAYSKGMKQKLTIAAGIIHNPEILFLDEPTTGIDVESARQIRRLIRELNDQGTTIFLTTHYIEEAERLCHRNDFIVSGEIIKVSTVEDLMYEAQQEHIVEFVLDEKSEGIQEVLSKHFLNLSFKNNQRNRIRVSSPERIEIMPLMRFFDENDIEINEARIIKPSLEDVFVKITGIEVERMKKEMEGKRK
jgi:ABC-2 type transport system ATP-binding protein